MKFAHVNLSYTFAYILGFLVWSWNCSELEVNKITYIWGCCSWTSDLLFYSQQ